MYDIDSMNEKQKISDAELIGNAIINESVTFFDPDSKKI